MKTVEITLWQMIETLAGQIPFTTKGVEAPLQITLRESVNTGNDVFRFYESPPVELAGGVVIANVDLRIKRAGEHPGFMVLELGGQCITLEEIGKHYSGLQMTSSPKGSSQHEKTHYTVMQDWGALSFGFYESNPKCLASISFKPGQ